MASRGSAPIPPMSSVRSSTIHSVGHDGEANELHVAFKRGGHYVYHDCGPEHHAAMLAHDSPGGYHDQKIKKGGFKFTRLA